MIGKLVWVGEAAGLGLDLGDLDHQASRPILVVQEETPALVPFE